MSNRMLRNLLRTARRRSQAQRGSTIVEFSLVFILFIVILMALMELGRGMWTYATLAHAARQTGRFCMTRGSTTPATTTEVRSVVDRHCRGLDTPSVTLSTSWKDPEDDTVRASAAAVERGDVVEVQLSYPFQLVTGRLIFAQQSLPMSATTRMIVAN